MDRIDELKAEIENAERELESKKKELKLIEKKLSFNVGDYVEATTLQRERIIGQLIGIAGVSGSAGYEVKACSMEITLINIPVKKWQPKKGDLCIFGDFGDEGNAIIGIFLEENNDNYPDCPVISITGVYDYCIPFISEQQFKEHIGYE